MRALAVLLLFCSCAQVTSLNLKKHQFGVVPTKIIWFQVAGLEEEQISMLRFREAGERRTAFEENTCIGKTWAYNLYDIRNPASKIFLAQMTGKKNIAGNCSDAEIRPIWSYLQGNGYLSGILETGASPEQSLLNFNQCGESGISFLSNLHYWVRGEPVKDASFFHYAEKIPFKKDQVIYDRTCSSRGCGSTITDDVTSIYEAIAKSSSKHLLIVRDFSYLKALEKKDIPEARRILSDIELAYDQMLKNAADSSEHLILLTTGDSRFMDMPDQGKSWFEFEKNSSNAQVKRSKLTNLVLASGARSENFCGMYESGQIFERILSGPKQQGLELKIINPFK
jgi:hypothetical protein